VNGPPIARRWREESGQVTAFVVVFVAALLLMAGLVIDGGLALAAQVRAIDEAQAAARAGAQSLDLRAYRASNAVVLDRPGRLQRRGLTSGRRGTAVEFVWPATGCSLPSPSPSPPRSWGSWASIR